MLKDFRQNYPALAALVALLIFGAGFFGMTHPSSVSSLVLLGGFVIFGLGVYLITLIVLRASGLSGRLSAYTQRLITAGTVLAVVVLLALQSLGQLTPRDAGAVLLLISAVCIYLAKLQITR
ncbi:MAG TPA: hypothetical protein VK983_04085 [Candidatus Limnocylindrales bacterium]|nr:hypothetical protein [Candidatus Limnocylindrales bacterium]